MKNYSIPKCRRILRSGFKLFKKKGHILTPGELKQFDEDLRELDQAVLNKQKKEASAIANRLASFIKTHFPKTLFDHIKEIAYALVFAIVVAFLIRQFWFELYEVPTGSMRPTIGELDRMVVSKTTFGIHIPFRKKNLLYSDDLIKRSGIIVFTVADMDVADPNTLYFRFIPGKKQLVKRCVSKPGDTLYFYGGQIYAVDKDGNPILTQTDPQFLESAGIEKIDHIPYITFDGKMKVSHSTAQNIYSAVTLKQMNLPVGKLDIVGRGKIDGQFFNGKQWVRDRVNALKAPHDEPVSYSDLWGIGNYAMARVLTKQEAHLFYRDVPKYDDTLMYLELRHTPNLTYPKPELRQDEQGRIHPMITPFATVIPLTQQHLDTLQQNLYTSRFFVENGHAFRYQEGRRRPQRQEFDPKFPNVPNGLYEFYYGIGYKVHFGGIRTKLPKDHPLYSSSPENIRKLFNQGTGFNIVYEPISPNQPYNPQRFAYYREGDLYVMGAPILKKTDPTLVRFTQSELEKQKDSTQDAPYIAFVDKGPPLKEDGSLDIDFVRAFGLKVPDDGVVGLGDNYSNSGDSRDFGFVPTENLRGGPAFTFWPPGNRLGSLAQPRYPLITAPNLIIWTLVVIVVVLCILWVKKRNQRSLF